MRPLSRLSSTVEAFERGTCDLCAASPRLLLLVAPLLMLLLAGCATSEKVQVKQVGDRDLSCREINVENRRRDETTRHVDNNRGITGINVASALFWLPGPADAYYDASQEDRAISERRAWPAGLYEEQ